MCGMADAKILSDDVSIGLGYFGGSVSVGELDYDSEDSTKEQRLVMFNKLCGYKSCELAGLLLDLVDNGDEA